MIALLCRFIQMYCDVCGKLTMHRMSEGGGYERYTCSVCGNSKEYRVR